ncbi:hypothetical protein BOTBODRAFT_482057 [Botryobasidium botryosum FD-172 SS1]|uniref:Uncharacterized protein n=1 Tax=Botryobasidium botryosum (strain FD-172 SS1) TaxID=930990 RepID=A0A067N5I2_BOTB1|nr:hypothetical protein BOTBODRAFT_482057 [Botryobasidium botryosum FD-172 SS1]
MTGVRPHPSRADPMAACFAPLDPTGDVRCQPSAATFVIHPPSLALRVSFALVPIPAMPSSLPLCAFQESLKSLSREFYEAYGEYQKSSKWGIERDGLHSRAQATLVVVLEKTCNLARQAVVSDSGPGPQDLLSFLSSVSNFESDLIYYACGPPGLLDGAVAPFCGNVVDESDCGVSARRRFRGSIRETSGGMRDEGAKRITPQDHVHGRSSARQPSNLADRPSSYTSLLARFREPRLTISESASSTLRTVAEARCEISAVDTPSPASMAITTSALAFLGRIGTSSRNQSLEVYGLERGVGELVSLGRLNPGLDGTARAITANDARELVFVADGSRIKSFRWNGHQKDQELLPVHTMDSGQSSSPLALLDGGARLLRVSDQKLLVWDVDNAPTHGKSGKKIVGKKMKPVRVDTMWEQWQDRADSTELSCGSKPSQLLSLSVDFSNGVRAWAQHPSQSSSMICGLDGQCRCIQFDVETGQVTNYWFGHGAHVSSVQTSVGNPWTFVTTSLDGVTRLYDVRQPAPVVAFFSSAEEVYSSALVHVDGHPFVFSGGTRSEQIKCWDVRARASSYELSTGNNRVNNLAWHASFHTLYAATECDYRERRENPCDYQWFRDPLEGLRDEIDDGEDSDGGESEDEDEEGRCWSAGAVHDELSFGCGFDSGNHKLLSYAFKVNAIPERAPSYGDAPVDKSWSW